MHSAEPLAAHKTAAIGGVAALRRCSLRSDEPVAEPLVIAFCLIVRNALMNKLTKMRTPKRMTRERAAVLSRHGS